MKRQSVSSLFFALSMLADYTTAENETFADKFLGGPLLILAALLIIVLMALVYHKIRR